MALIKWMLASVGVAGMIGGFFGSYHGFGDLLAAFRLENIVVIVVLGVWFLWRGFSKIALLLAMVALGGLYTVWPYVKPYAVQADTTYTLYQKNLGARHIDVDAFIKDLDFIDPDFVTLQELVLSDGRIPAALRERFEHVRICFSRPKGAMVVASRWPIANNSARCAGSWGLVKMQAQTPDGPIWVVSIHSYRPLPWAYVQNRQADRMQKYMPEPQESFIFGGDFNSVPWGSPLLNTAAHLDAKYGDRVRLTFVRWGIVRLSLDHILMDQQTQTGGTELRPKFGSDHYGLLGRFSITSRP